MQAAMSGELGEFEHLDHFAGFCVSGLKINPKRLYVTSV